MKSFSVWSNIFVDVSDFNLYKWFLIRRIGSSRLENNPITNSYGNIRLLAKNAIPRKRIRTWVFYRRARNPYLSLSKKKGWISKVLLLLGIFLGPNIYDLNLP